MIHSLCIENDPVPEVVELGEAIGNFTGTTDEQTDRLQQQIEKQRKFLDCLIVGYTTNTTGDSVHSLVLAREFQQKLIFVAQVAIESDDAPWQEHLVKFQRKARTSPFVATSINAHWIEPVYTCRASYVEESETGKLTGVRFEKMLGALD